MRESLKFRLLNFKFRSRSFRSSFPFSPCFCGCWMESFTRCVFFLFDLMSAGENSKFSGICRASFPDIQRYLAPAGEKTFFGISPLNGIKLQNINFLLDWTVAQRTEPPSRLCKSSQSSHYCDLLRAGSTLGIFNFSKSSTLSDVSQCIKVSSIIISTPIDSD